MTEQQRRLLEALIRRYTLAEVWPSQINQILTMGDLKARYRFNPNILQDQILSLQEALASRARSGVTDAWNYRPMAYDVAIPGGIAPLVPGLDRPIR